MIGLDTNVLSEAFKPSPSEAVLAWLGAQEPPSVFITTITQAKLLCGIEMLPAGKRRVRLPAAIEKVCIVAGRDALGRPISQFDAMIAAIARSRRAALATRNASDFEHCGVRIINPWSE